MPGSPICVDASFVVALVTPEALSAKAVELWEEWATKGARIIAPSLLRYEVTSAIRRKVARGFMEPEDARGSLREALSLGIEFHDSAELSLRAFELCSRFNWAAAYDAHYLALAEETGAEFWTADQRLVRTVGKLFSFVHWVGEA